MSQVDFLKTFEKGETLLLILLMIFPRLAVWLLNKLF